MKKEIIDKLFKDLESIIVRKTEVPSNILELPSSIIRQSRAYKSNEPIEKVVDIVNDFQYLVDYVLVNSILFGKTNSDLEMKVPNDTFEDGTSATSTNGLYTRLFKGDFRDKNLKLNVGHNWENYGLVDISEFLKEQDINDFPYLAIPRNTIITIYDSPIKSKIKGDETTLTKEVYFTIDVLDHIYNSFTTRYMEPLTK